MNLDWMDDAACAGADRDGWFPGAGGNEACRRAVQVCLGCPVRAQCLEFHLGVEDVSHGVAGAMTARERELVRA